jgi:hypothetical protein
MDHGCDPPDTLIASLDLNSPLLVGTKWTYLSQ